jgi:hypothetical protein
VNEAEEAKDKFQGGQSLTGFRWFSSPRQVAARGVGAGLLGTAKTLGSAAVGVVGEGRKLRVGNELPDRQIYSGPGSVRQARASAPLIFPCG